MATQNPTANYEWVLPTVGGSADAWGTIINALIGDDATGIDATIKALETASKIATHVTSGEFAAARIPSLDAAKIATGEFAAARIPTLDAAKIGTGTLAAARIPTLDAAKIGTGTFANARIAASSVTQHQAALAIAATQLTGTVPSARIAGAYTGITAVGELSSDLNLSANIGRGTALDGVLIVAGGDVSGAQGNASANIRLYGKNHVSAPNKIEFRVNTSVRGTMNMNSGGAFTWDADIAAGSFSTAGSVTAATFIKSA